MDEETIQNQKIVEAARRTIERIYKEIASGNRFHWVLLDELESALAKAGKHPFQDYGAMAESDDFDRRDPIRA